MRNSLCRVFTLALITTIALACNDHFVESTSSVAELESNPLLEVEMESAASRTAIDEELNISWHADDRIAVFYGNRNNIECRFDGDTGDVRGTISAVESIDIGDKHSIDAIFAYYPYDANVAINDYEEFEITLQAVQHYAEHGFGRGANPMVAVTESLSHHSLSFRNVGAMLKLQIWGNATVKSITFKGNNQEVLAGEATLIASHDILPDIELKSSGEKSVTLDCGDGVALGTSADAPTDFWIVLPPTTFTSGFTVEVTDTQGRIFTKSTTRGVFLKRNRVVPVEAFEISYDQELNPNELWYTTTNGAQISLSANMFNNTIESHVKVGDKWVVTFSDALTAIQDEAFSSNSSLKSITLPESVTSIGDKAFYQCVNLAVVNLPKSISYIGSQAFNGCNAISELTISGYPDDYPSVWGNNPFDNTSIDKLIVECNLVGAEIVSGSFDRDPLFVGSNVSNIVFTPEVDCIGAYSFFAASSVKSVSIPYGVEIIGEGAFMYCDSLEEVTFPESITYIGSSVLEGCSSLTHVTSLATTPPALGSRAFPANLQVRVPDYAFSAYQNDSEWNRYTLSNLAGETYESSDYSADGKVTILQRASEGNGVNIVFLGDGFSDRQIAAGYYEEYCRFAMETLFDSEPYKSFRHLFNVYMVTAVSKSERIDDVHTVGRTKFDTYFTDTGDVIGNDALVNSYAKKAVGEAALEDALVIVILNSNYRAGICYLYSPTVYDPEQSYWCHGASISYCAMCGNDDEFKYLILHEAGGHGFAKLADEYFYSGNGEITNSDYYYIVDWLDKFNWYMNVDYIKGGTKDASNVKWKHMLADERYQYEGLGVFEGGLTYPKGVFRSTEYSIMRSEKRGSTRSYNYNAPSRETIYRRIHHLAYGSSWAYDYEKFVEYDAINRKSAAEASYSVSAQSVVYGCATMPHSDPKLICN